MFSLNEIFDIAIKIERNGETAYRKAIDKADKPELASLLGWIADEEMKHTQWLNELRDKYLLMPSGGQVEEISSDLLNELLGDHSLSLDDVDFANIHEVNELIKVWIEFEEDTVLFYEMLQQFIEEEQTTGLIDQIIAEEKKHIANLKELIPSPIQA
ncbi:MAG: ferritin family protein [Desulfobacterales bacterium]|nr:ferritin family protein [Desulfobacterales bacterium]